MTVRKVGTLFVGAVTSVALLASSGCELRTSQISITEALLRQIDRTLADCNVAVEATAEVMNCLDLYAQAHQITLESVLVDGFGNQLVTMRSDKCSEEDFCGPYSLGVDGVDQCGRSDDIVLEQCQR